MKSPWLKRRFWLWVRSVLVLFLLVYGLFSVWCYAFYSIRFLVMGTPEIVPWMAWKASAFFSICLARVLSVVDLTEED